MALMSRPCLAIREFLQQLGRFCGACAVRVKRFFIAIVENYLAGLFSGPAPSPCLAQSPVILQGL